MPAPWPPWAHRPHPKSRYQLPPARAPGSAADARSGPLAEQSAQVLVRPAGAALGLSRRRGRQAPPRPAGRCARSRRRAGELRASAGRNRRLPSAASVAAITAGLAVDLQLRYVPPRLAVGAGNHSAIALLITSALAGSRTLREGCVPRLGSRPMTACSAAPGAGRKRGSPQSLPAAVRRKGRRWCRARLSFGREANSKARRLAISADGYSNPRGS